MTMVGERTAQWAAVCQSLEKSKGRPTIRQADQSNTTGDGSTERRQVAACECEQWGLCAACAGER